MSTKTIEKTEKTKYSSVSLPEDMLNSISSFIAENPHLAFSSIAEFIRSAVREKMKQEIKNQPLKKVIEIIKNTEEADGDSFEGYHAIRKLLEENGMKKWKDFDPEA